MELQPPGRHQVQQQHEVVLEVEHEQLAAPAHARERLAVDRLERRVEGLQSVDAGREARLDPLARQHVAQSPRDDLHLGQLGHASTLVRPGAGAARSGPGV